MTRKLAPRCQALDDDGRACRNRSEAEEHYHGDPELYRSRGAAWVLVHLCADHLRARPRRVSAPAPLRKVNRRTP